MNYWFMTIVKDGHASLIAIPAETTSEALSEAYIYMDNFIGGDIGDFKVKVPSPTMHMWERGTIRVVLMLS